MGIKFQDENLINYLLKFVCGMPIECHDIRYIDLYDNKKPCELFQDLLCSTDGVNYFFTQLKKKSEHSKNFNRTIVGGGGSWKGRDTSKPVLDKKGSVIGFKKTFRFDEESSGGSDNKRNVYWIMKEYCLKETVVKKLRQCGKIRHEDYVVCSITRKVRLYKKSQEIENAVRPRCHTPISGGWPIYNAAETSKLPPLDGPFESLTEEELAFFDKPDPGYPQAYKNNKLE